MLHCGDEVKLARTMMRLPENNKWDKEALSNVHATPWDLLKLRDPEIVFREKTGVEQNDFENKVSLVRQPYIKSSDMEEHAMTRGCPK